MDVTPLRPHPPGPSAETLNKSLRVGDQPPMNSRTVFLKTVPNCFLSPGYNAVAERSQGEMWTHR